VARARCAASTAHAADASAGVARQLAQRQDGFLALLRRVGFPGPRAAGATLAPYQRLLRHAGCEYGDVDGLVRREGVEHALRRLYRDGVYLTGTDPAADRDRGI
jgi:hypothetical protein